MLILIKCLCINLFEAEIQEGKFSVSCKSSLTSAWVIDQGLYQGWEIIRVCVVEYSCPGMFDGLCDIVDDSVGDVGDGNWLAFRYKYRMESARLYASQTRQRSRIYSQSPLLSSFWVYFYADAAPEAG